MAVYLIEILLPARSHKLAYAQTRDELVERFGGLTAHSLAPVAGLWEDEKGNVVQDDIIIYEVITARVEKAWWADYRRTLERRFEQTELVIRSNEIDML